MNFQFVPLSRPIEVKLTMPLAGMTWLVIARGNMPVVRLVPVSPRGRRCFGALKGKIAMDTRFDEPLPEDELGG